MKTNTGSTLPENLSQNTTPIKKKLGVKRDDYIDEGLLGEGGYGKVYLVKSKNNNKMYALKEISKSVLSERNQHRVQIEEIFNERNIMKDSSSPFIVKLISSFQDEYFIYFVMEFMNGGNLFSYLRHSKRPYMLEKDVKFYTAEIILALEYLHEEKGIIYRDLKPENLLISTSGHLKLSDFGLAKKDKDLKDEVKGTPGFIAPEIYKRGVYNKTADYWSLGCLVYEMAFGQPVFSMINGESSLKNQILLGSYTFPFEIKISIDLKDFIRKLLEVNPEKRLGKNGIAELQEHPWFADIDWTLMKERKLPPPVKFNEMQVKKSHRSKCNFGKIAGPKIDMLTLSPIEFDKKSFNF